MKKDWILTQELFDELLLWLNPDRELAGQEYEALRNRLVKLFACRRCLDPEDLADETMNRVANKVSEIKGSFVGPPAPYFFAVANKVQLESLRSKSVPNQQPPAPDLENIERDYGCLELCLEQQTSPNRHLVLEYYRGEKHEKIVHRKKLADQYGIALNALRIRAHRIRGALQECVENCINAQI